MQQLAILQESGQTAKSSSSGKKGKTGSNSKTGKNKSQFTEILAQLASTPQLANNSRIKQSGSFQSDTAVNKVGTTTGKTGSTAAPGKDAKSVADATERSLAWVTTKTAMPSKQSNDYKAGREENSGGDLNQLAKTANMLSSREKTNKADETGPVSNTAKESGETVCVQVPEASNQSINPSEIKIADLMGKNGLKALENKSVQATDSKSGNSPEVSANLAKANFDAVSPGEGTRQRDQDTGSEAGKKQNRVTPMELSLNTVENGLVKTEGVETNGLMAAPKTVMSQSQTDYLVNKMVQQVNVAPGSLEVSLKPEYLGKVSILVKSLEGVVTVNVIAHNTEAMHLLNSNLHNIKNSLEQQGINVQQMDVNLANQGRQENHSESGYREQMQAALQPEKSDLDMEYTKYSTGGPISSGPYEINLLA